MGKAQTEVSMPCVSGLETMSETNPPQRKLGDRWTALTHEGKKLVLTGPNGKWYFTEVETEKHAASIVKELCLWAKQEYNEAEFNRLCRASD
jgi:hypothetical protein